MFFNRARLRENVFLWVDPLKLHAVLRKHDIANIAVSISHVFQTSFFVPTSASVNIHIYYVGWLQSRAYAFTITLVVTATAPCKKYNIAHT